MIIPKERLHWRRIESDVFLKKDIEGETMFVGFIGVLCQEYYRR